MGKQDVWLFRKPSRHAGNQEVGVEPPLSTIPHSKGSLTTDSSVTYQHLPCNASEDSECRFASRDHVDGLRAFAVLAVLVYHTYRRWLPSGGFTGVDIFFVISGYVVGGSLIGQPRDRMEQFVLHFCARMLLRLLPSLMVVTCITAFFMALLVPPSMPELGSFYATGVLGLVGLSNQPFVCEEITSAHGLQNPFLHTWVVSVKGQFCFMFSFIFFACHGQKLVAACDWRPKWPFSSLVLFCSFSVSILLTTALTFYNQKSPFFTMPCRYWEFMLGALVHDAEAFAPLRFHEAGLVVIVALDVTAVLMLILALIITPEDARCQLPWAALPASSAALFLVAGSSSESWSRTLFGNRAMVALGRLSYPLYLWHWPVMVLSDFGILHITGQDPSWLVTFFVRILQGILTLALALATSMFETSVRILRPQPTWRTSALLGSFLLATACWLGLLSGPLAGRLYIGGSQPSGSAHLDHPIDVGGQPSPFGAALAVLANKSATNDPLTPFGAALAVLANRSATNDPLTPSTSAPTTSTTQKPRPTAAPNPCSCCKRGATLHVPQNVSGTCGKEERPCFVGKRPYREWFGGGFKESCWCWKAGTCTERVAKCLTPDRGQDGKGRAMFLIGDSHATMYVIALREAIGDAYSLSTTTRANSECFRLDASYPNYCAAVQNGIKKNLRSGDVLALAFATWEFSPYKLDKVRFGRLENIREYALMLKTWHTMVTARDATMILLGDQTPLAKPGLRCVSTSFNQDDVSKCSRTVQWSNFYGRHFRDQMKVLEQAWPNVYFFDPRALFCTAQACGAMVPGTHTLATGDLDHLTVEGSYYLWPFLCSFLHKKGLLG